MREIELNDARQVLIVEALDFMAKRLRTPMIEIDKAALDNAARALVLTLDGSPATTTTVINFKDLVMTREFYSAFMGYVRAHGLRVR